MSPQSHQTSLNTVAAGLSEQLGSHLRRRLGGQVSDLRVTVREGGLVLQGRTRTHHAKQIALQAVLEITELPILANEIRVGPAAALARAGLGGRGRSRTRSNPIDLPRTP
jgi:osmotically-inducible protein OsmY